MKVGFLIYGDLDIISGGYIYDKKLVEALRDLGHEVQLISLPWLKYFLAFFQNFSPNFRRDLMDLNVDILVQDELVHPSLFLMNKFVLSNRKFPIVSLVHHLRSQETHPKIYKSIYKYIEKKYLSEVDGYIFVSQATKSSVEELVWVKDKTYVLVNPPADRLGITLNDEEIIRRLDEDEKLRILFIGSVTPRKSLINLIKALDGLPKDLYDLTIVGNLSVDRRYVAQNIRLINELGLDNNVNFSGLLNDVEIVEILKHHDLMVVPSTMEGFGMVYLEGMAFGLPAIGSSSGAASEIITHGKNGYLISPNDFSALNQHLSFLIENRNLLAEMSLSARKRYDLHPPWQKSVKTVEVFLETLFESVVL